MSIYVTGSTGRGTVSRRNIAYISTTYRVGSDRGLGYGDRRLGYGNMRLGSGKRRLGYGDRRLGYGNRAHLSLDFGCEV
eukprot:3177319-Rhodomonas_salina.1